MSILQIGHLNKSKESMIGNMPVEDGKVVYSENSGMQFVDYAGERHTYGSILSGIYTNNYGFLDFTSSQLSEIISAIKDNSFVIDGQIIRAGNTVYQYRKVRDKHFIIKMNDTGIVMNKFKIGYAVYLPDFVEGDKVSIDFLIAIDNDVFEDKVFYVKVQDNQLDVSQCDDMNAKFNPDEFDINIIHDGNGLFTISTTITSTMNIISCTVNSTGSSIYEEFYIVESDLDIDYEWVEKSSLPYGGNKSSVVVYNGEIHLLGGSNNTTGHYKWDGTEWTEVSTLPYEFHDGCAVVYKNEIHIMGSGDSVLATNHYKWDGNEWTEASTLPYEVRESCAVTYVNDIHLFGGFYQPNAHYVWDGNEWTQSTDVPYEVSYGSATIYNREIHLLGSSKTESGTKHYKWDNAVWTEVSTLPVDFNAGRVVVCNGVLNLLGGTSFPDIHYKWDGTEWLQLDTALPYGFSYGNAIVFNNEIHLIGSSDESTGTTDHYEFNKKVK